MTEGAATAERRAGMGDVGERLARLEEQAKGHARELSEIKTTVAGVRKETQDDFQALHADVKQLTAAYNQSKGLRVLGYLGVSTLASAIGSAITYVMTR